tara:strand:- start:2394 stop:3023 length:630 start_codon:yes stop_codon:yes gene_type:complete
MVSFIPCYKKSNPNIQAIQLVAISLFLILLLISPTTQAEGIKLKFVELDAVDSGYQFNADLGIVLNPTLKKALKKGIKLYFVTDFRLESPRWYWFDKRVARSKQRDSLSYYALTRQYRLSAGLQNQSFSTLKEALRVLGRVRGRPIEANSKLLQNKTYIAKLRIRLDLSRMRKPFQVEALSSKEWNLSSGWHQWKLKFPIQRIILQDKQ